MTAAGNPNDPMSPDYHPTPSVSGVKRINNGPLLVGLTLIAGFVGVMGYVAMERAERQKRPETITAEKGTGSGAAFARSITSMATEDYINPPETVVEVPPPPQPAPKLEPPKPLGTNLPALAPLPPPPVVDQEALERAKRARLATSNLRDLDLPKRADKQELLAQIDATNRAANGLTAAALSDNPTHRFRNELAHLQGGNTDAPGTARAPASTVNAGGSRWDMETKREAAKSPYTLRAGFVIPASLITGLNSQLPGEVIGQVSRNIYSPPTFEHLLIPQGSRLYGVYVSNVQYGQSRIMVAWQRIIYPDGRAQDIGEMPGTDTAGYSGFNDKVNNHYLRIFGSAILLSGITAGISYSQNPGTGNSDRQTASDVMSQSLGQVLGQTASQMIQKNMNIAPTLEIRPGYQFNINVTKDMVFDSPYVPSY